MPEYTVTVDGREYDVDAPNEATAWKWANKTHATYKAGFGKRVEANREQWAKDLDPSAESRLRLPFTDVTVGGETLGKLAANLGAGYANFGQGARQLASKVDLANPVSDEEVLEKRARDKALAKSTETGAGPSWMPSAGSALQFAGEVAPTLAIPAGAATGTAARVLPRALQAAVSTPLRAGITGGAVSGALMPTTSEESKSLNTLLGAGGGAILPGAVAGYRGLRGVSNAPARAGGRLLRAIGEENVPDVAQSVARRQAERAGQAPAVRAIPETLAEASGHTGIARLESELGRSAESSDEMGAFLRRQNVARHQAVQEATREAPMLGAREAVRGQVTDPMRSAALQAASGDQFFHTPVVETVQRISASPSSVNPAVRRVLNEVMSNMDDRAPMGITPERLYEVRKLLADKLDGPTQIGDELSNAVKGANRETMALIQSIDEALNQSSGGQFGRYMQTYQRASRPIEASRAAQEAREVFQREGLNELGGVPEVTATRMGAAMRAAEGGAGRRFPLALSAGGQQQMGDILGGITRANEVQSAAIRAGARGGSRSSTDLDAVIRQVGTRSGIPLIGAVLDAAGTRMTDATKIELARLVQNPDAAMVAIRQAQRLRQPLTEAQQLLLQASSRGAAGALPLALQAQSTAP